MKPFKPTSLAEKFDPEDSPLYPNPSDMPEDEDAASTLKSAHLAEWVHGMVADEHHHHDPYYFDQHGKRHYKRGNGYEGKGHNHYGKKEDNGYYGVDTPGYSVSKGFEDAYGLYKGKDLKAEGTVP